MAKTFNDFLVESSDADFSTEEKTRDHVHSFLKAHGPAEKGQSSNYGKYVYSKDEKVRDAGRNGKLYSHLRKHGFVKKTTGHGMIHHQHHTTVYAGPHGYVHIGKADVSDKTKATLLKKHATTQAKISPEGKAASVAKGKETRAKNNLDQTQGDLKHHLKKSGFKHDGKGNWTHKNGMKVSVHD